MLLSFVIPCFNEADSIVRLHAEVSAGAAAAADDYEIVYVDDGSTDGTLAGIRALATTDGHVRYVSFSRNFGKESAMLAGLQAARGGAVIILDADLQHPPDLIPRMVELHRQGFDQVVARRDRRGDAFTRTLLSRTFYLLVNRWIDVRLVDGVGDFRLISRRVVDAVLALPEYNRFSKGLFAWVGFDTALINYENAARQGDTSRWTLRKLLNYAMDGLLSFNNRPLRMAIYLGLLMSTVALAYVAWIVGRALAFGIDAPGYVTLLAAVVGLGGLNMMVLGVIGEYVGRIYYESKRRPHFLVKESHLADGPNGRAPQPPRQAAEPAPTERAPT